ncbi:hypothetical protein Plim_0944 [Planctopirus limnophila DSM 3776]|uniref:Uncharacterized protein n=2 Tax=Planctopirus limnophila TaxID=120 RepID=D5ST20_PLAL2|nr:hypothetical protein Plim_0944 [Planctopirus limnophila DSM 3776]
MSDMSAMLAALGKHVFATHNALSLSGKYPTTKFHNPESRSALLQNEPINHRRFYLKVVLFVKVPHFIWRNCRLAVDLHRKHLHLSPLSHLRPWSRMMENWPPTEGKTMEQTSAPMFVLSTDGELHGVDTEGNRELVRRIYACVQACEGISTDELEMGVVAEMKRLLGQVVPLLQNRSAAVAEREAA